MRPGVKLTVILVTAVLFWGGVACFLCCSGSPQKRAVAVAEKALMVIADKPESVKILAVSRADSVFGREYATDKEKVSLSMAMMRINEKVMAETDGLENFDPEDKEMISLMERQMEAISALRSLMSYENPHGGTAKVFTGWKVKIEYEVADMDGKPRRSEYWFIIDKEATCVVKSFEIPLV